MTNNEAAKWIQLYIDLAKIDPLTGEAAYLNDDDHLIVYGIRRDEATTIATRPSKIIDTTTREVEENKKTNLNVPFSAIRKICKYYSVSCDRYGDGKWVSECHHPELVLSGDSWGKCSIDTCQLYAERKSEKND